MECKLLCGPNGPKKKKKMNEPIVNNDILAPFDCASGHIAAQTVHS